jgi:hypothetical protein
LEALGLFFECLPDRPELCKDAELINENKKRLKFYERFGARPIINTLYELPVKESDTCPPHWFLTIWIAQNHWWAKPCENRCCHS